MNKDAGIGADVGIRTCECGRLVLRFVPVGGANDGTAFEYHFPDAEVPRLAAIVLEHARVKGTLTGVFKAWQERMLLNRGER